MIDNQRGAQLVIIIWYPSRIIVLLKTQWKITIKSAKKKGREETKTERKGRQTVKDLLNESGQYLSFQEFISKYHCKTNFLQYYQYYQIVSSIPNHLLLEPVYLRSSYPFLFEK